jgi:dipeptidyl aminopeptidase/acylaminoacyl peptidase
MSAYAFESSNRIICVYAKNGMCYLGSLDIRSGKLEQIESPYCEIWQVRAARGCAVCIAGSPEIECDLVKFDLLRRDFETIYSPRKVGFDNGFISVPRRIEFSTGHGVVGHAFFYAPKNRAYSGPPCRRPPLIVICHGGPTDSAWASLTWKFSIGRVGASRPFVLTMVGAHDMVVDSENDSTANGV